MIWEFSFLLTAVARRLRRYAATRKSSIQSTTIFLKKSDGNFMYYYSAGSFNPIKDFERCSETSFVQNFLLTFFHKIFHPPHRKKSPFRRCFDLHLISGAHNKERETIFFQNNDGSFLSM